MRCRGRAGLKPGPDNKVFQCKEDLETWYSSGFLLKWHVGIQRSFFKKMKGSFSTLFLWYASELTFGLVCISQFQVYT